MKSSCILIAAAAALSGAGNIEWMTFKPLPPGISSGGDLCVLIGDAESFEPAEETGNAAIKCIESGLGNGGYIFTSSNAITDSVPVENYFFCHG